MGRRGARRLGLCLTLLCLVVLPASCYERPTQQDKDVVQSLLTQYLKDRANRLTQAGTAMAGLPLTSVRLEKKFAARVAGDAAKLDARRRGIKQKYARAEVIVTLDKLDLDGSTATATIHDQTTLYRAAGDPSGPDATKFDTDREFTLEREGSGWAVSGASIIGPDLEQQLPQTDFPN